MFVRGSRAWCRCQVLREEIDAKYANKVRFPRMTRSALMAQRRNIMLRGAGTSRADLAGCDGASFQVMADVGLFVCCRTIDEIGTGKVYDGDGYAHTPGT